MELAHYVQGGIYRKHDRSDTGVFTMFINTRHAAGNNIEIVKRWGVFRCQKYLGEGSSIISEALGSTWAFSAHFDVRSINASSCVRVCTQMQASFMLITS